LKLLQPVLDELDKVVTAVSLASTNESSRARQVIAERRRRACVETTALATAPTALESQLSAKVM
jgi:hypothetical protein